MVCPHQNITVQDPSAERVVIMHSSKKYLGCQHVRSIYVTRNSWVNETRTFHFFIALGPKNVTSVSPKSEVAKLSISSCLCHWFFSVKLDKGGNIYVFLDWRGKIFNFRKGLTCVESRVRLQTIFQQS